MHVLLKYNVLGPINRVLFYEATQEQLGGENVPLSRIWRYSFAKVVTFPQQNAV